MALVNDQRQLLTAGKGKGIVLWDIASGKRLKKFAHRKTIYAIDLFRDETSFLVGDESGTISQYRLDRSVSDEPMAIYRDDSEDITALRVTPDQQGFVAGNADGKVDVWKLAAEDPASQFRGLKHWTCCLQFSDDGRQLFGCDYSGNVALWHVASQKPVWIQEEISGDICWGRFVDQNRIVAVDSDNNLFNIERKTGKSTKQTIVIPAAAGFDLSANRKTLWSGGTHLLCGWEIASGKRIFPDDQAMQLIGGIQDLVVKSGLAYVKNTSPRVSIWDIESGRRIRKLELGELMKADWDDAQIIPVEKGIVIGGREGLIVIDGQTNSKIQSESFSNQHLLPSRKQNCLNYVADSDPQMLMELNLDSGIRRPLLHIDHEERQFGRCLPLDEYTMAVIVNQHPDILQIRSLAGNSVLDEWSSEEDFQIVDSCKHLLMGLLSDSEVVVFRSGLLGLESPGALEQPAIVELIDQLDNASWEVRDRAFRRLARGGETATEVIRNTQPRSLEMQVQLQRIRQYHALAVVPELDHPLEMEPPIRNAEAIALDPRGRFFLVSTPNQWRSDLQVCVVDEGSWSVAQSTIPLRTSVSTITAVANEGADENDGLFAIGYMDGTIDIIQVVIPVEITPGKLK